MSTQAISAPGRTLHQKRMHRIVERQGYEFLRRDGLGHNLYVNAHGQRISIPGTPKNPGHNERHTLTVMQRNERERQGVMPAAVPTKDIDRYMEMVDPFLLKEPKPGDKLAEKARFQALIGFLGRLVAKTGPIPSNDVNEIINRLGFNNRQARDARDYAKLVSYKDAQRWMTARIEQVPAGKKFRAERKTNIVPPELRHEETPEPASEPTPEAPEPEQSEVLVDTPKRARERALLQGASDAEVKQVAPVTPAPLNGNVTAAAQMLLAELGYHMPGPGLRIALEAAHASTLSVLQAIEAAQKELSQAGL